MSESNSEAMRLLRELRLDLTSVADSPRAKVMIAKIDALLALADKDNKLQAQGLCETTLTPRFQVPNCTCDTYKDNLGPCLTWWEGGRIGYCVYCDHNLACHVKLSKMLADKDNAAPQVSAQSSELSNASQSGSASAVIPEPAVSAPDNAAGQVTGNSSLNSSSMENRLDLPAPAAPSAPAEVPTPETDRLNTEHAHSSMADAAGMGTEIPCEQAYVEMFELARRLERQRDAALDARDRLGAGYQELQRELTAALSRERLANMRADQNG